MSIYKKQLPLAIVTLLCTSQLSANFARAYTTEEDPKRAEEIVYCEEKCYTNKGFFIMADYLLWHATECGLAYGIRAKSEDNKDGKVQNLHFEWDSGYRVGLGYRLPHDKWQLSLMLTGFGTDADGSAHAKSDLLYPEWQTEVIPTGAGNDIVRHLKGKWEMSLHILDGEISRYFLATSRIGLKPHFGLRGVWIDQDYDARISGGFFPAEQILVLKDRYKMTNNFAGVGLLMGLDTEWDLGQRFSLYANAAYSLIYGHFELKEQEQRQLLDQKLFPVLSIHDNFHQNVSIADLNLGLRWIYTFANCWAIRLQAGWEFISFFGQNKFEHFGTASTKTLGFVANNEDLTIQGFVLSGRFDF